MKKVCVFCGEKPEAKEKEHVIPLWLIEMTGDPNRIAAFGLDFPRTPSVRKFAFDQLTFPACSGCNRAFGTLEEKVKPIVTRLLADQAASSSDFLLLLDWLDKVRVGLWLGYLYLDKNPLGIDPTFYVGHRVAQLDRMVAIIRIADKLDSLSFTGPEFKGYQLSPTCLGLRVNGLFLLNASGIGVCSHRLGFPYVEPVSFNNDRKLEVISKNGSGRIMRPVNRELNVLRASTLYQPIFRNLLAFQDANRLLASEWVREHAEDLAAGQGKLFMETSESVELYPDEPTLKWIPSGSWDMLEVMRMPCRVQGYIHRNYQKSIPLFSSKEERKQVRIQATMTGRLDRAVLRISERRIRELEMAREKGEEVMFNRVVLSK